MKVKLLKRTIKLLAVVLGGIVLAFAIVVGLMFLRIGISQYQSRFVEYQPKQVLPVLERVFNFNFPADIKEVKTAQTISRDGFIHFIARFVAEPDTIQRFLESFTDMNMFQPYKSEADLRDWGFWPPPRWFKKPIKQGRIYADTIARPGRNLRQIYIDTTNEKDFLVYMQGSYSSNLDIQE